MYTLGNKWTHRVTTNRAPRKAISPVIATIILIAITIVIAIAVAGWVFGLFGSYSRTNAVTIVASASSCTASQHQCNIVLSNQGSSAVTVVSASVYGQSAALNTISGGTVVPAGSSATVVVSISSTIVAGQTVDIQLGLSNGATLTTTLVVSS
jgi:flagellin-like protein